jgi:integrase
LAEAERLVTLNAYVPPAQRRAEAERALLSLHTAVAEFLGNMATNRKATSYVDTTAYLLFNFLEFFQAVDLRESRHLAPEVLPRCRLRIAKHKATSNEEMLRLLEPQPSDRPLRRITTPIVEAYKAYRLDVADADETTVNNELKILRMFGKWMKRRAGLNDDPFEMVKDVTDDGEAAGRTLEVVEFASLVRACKDGLRPWVMLTGLHGLRKGETNHLRPEDINVEEGFLDIRIHRNAQGKIIWQPKFRKERKVPIVERALPFAASIRDLPTDAHGHVLGVHDRTKAFNRATDASCVEGHVRIHDLRHTAYTQLKEAILKVQDTEITLADMRLIFGHGDNTMDRIYDHRSLERMRKLMELNPLTEGVADLLAG